MYVSICHLRQMYENTDFLLKKEGEFFVYIFVFYDIKSNFRKMQTFGMEERLYKPRLSLIKLKIITKLHDKYEI